MSIGCSLPALNQSSQFLTKTAHFELHVPPTPYVHSASIFFHIHAHIQRKNLGGESRDPPGQILSRTMLS